ncbi:hypothetical protein HJG60_009972 [Phyllostomus discolor]|uniref:Uncharacterized protein n=1 Tax=Phyllostomus discolor TaxID=89673 RepID=A0A834B7A1_9CHIR|nr:hypothetical protein HJG60_009972 [Phyllostomus discolor]
MEAKPDGLLSVSQSTNKASGAIHSGSQSPGTEGVTVGGQSLPAPQSLSTRSTPVRRTEEVGVSSQTETELALPPPVCSTRALRSLDSVRLCGRAISMTQSTHSSATLSRDTVTRKLRNHGSAAPRAPLSPVKWTHKTDHHTSKGICHASGLKKNTSDLNALFRL